MEEILVHIAAPSSARDDARYRAQVAAIRALAPVSRSNVLIPNANDDHSASGTAGIEPSAAAAAAAAEDLPPTDDAWEPAEAADGSSSLLRQASELDSVTSSVLATAGSATTPLATIASANHDQGLEYATYQTSSYSRCAGDWNVQLRKNSPVDKLPSLRADEYHHDPESYGAASNTDAAISATAARVAVSNSESPPVLCSRGDLPSIISSSEGNQITAASPPLQPSLQAPAPAEQIHDVRGPPGSLGSLTSVIPDSQPERCRSIQQADHPASHSWSPSRSTDEHGRASKRRIQQYQPQLQASQTITFTVASERTTITSIPAYSTEKAYSKGKSCAAPPGKEDPNSHSHTRPNHSSSSPINTADPIHEASTVSSTEKTNQRCTSRPQQGEDISGRGDLHHGHTTILSSFPLSLHPPQPPISSSTFTTHITPTLAMLTERLKPTRTYKPRHQSRGLDKLERGYWLMHIKISLEKPETEQDQEKEKKKEIEKGKEKLSAKNSTTTPISIFGPGPGSTTISGSTSKSTSKPSQPWTETQFTHFWTFLTTFIAKEARAGWGVWCIAERLENHATQGPGNPQGPTNLTSPHNPDPDLDPTTKLSIPSAHTSPSQPRLVPVILRVYAWGEVAMHIYLLLYLASERRVRGMGLRWVDSKEEVVIQMP